ncbi:MAG: ABC transporter ATP-binding protein [Actinomycetota bacterium]
MSPAVHLQGVGKSFMEGAVAHRVLDGIDLDVSPGEVLALVGRSGSGKTTLLTVAAGLEVPDEGTVTVLGHSDPSRLGWSEVALLPQALGLLEELTLLENATLSERLGLSLVTEPEALLERLGLGHLGARHPSEVSLGEQQRAALVRAAVVGPAVLLADEPISHQNAGWAQAVLGVLADLAAAGTAVILATHHPAALAVAGRVLEMRSGRLAPPRVGL